MHDYEVTLCVYRGEDEETEIELTVQGSVEPFVPGRYHGPPERCYPDEGGDAEVCAVLLAGKPWDGELTDRETDEAKRLLRQAEADARESYDESRAEEAYEDRMGGGW